MTDPARDTDALATPLAWADADGRIRACNPAFASWLGVSARRLQGLALTELDAEDGRLAALLPRLADSGEATRGRPMRGVTSAAASAANSPKAII